MSIDDLLKSLPKSPLPADRQRVCEPISQELKDVLLAKVGEGQITLREAADVALALAFAFNASVKLMEDQGLTDELDRLHNNDRDDEWG